MSKLTHVDRLKIRSMVLGITIMQLDAAIRSMRSQKSAAKMREKYGDEFFISVGRKGGIAKGRRYAMKRCEEVK